MGGLFVVVFFCWFLRKSNVSESVEKNEMFLNCGFLIVWVREVRPFLGEVAGEFCCFFLAMFLEFLAQWTLPSSSSSTCFSWEPEKPSARHPMKSKVSIEYWLIWLFNRDPYNIWYMYSPLVDFS